MLRTIFWTMIFLLGASMVAIQPACQNFSEKPMRRLLRQSSDGPSSLKLVWPNSGRG